MKFVKSEQQRAIEEGNDPPDYSRDQKVQIMMFFLLLKARGTREEFFDLIDECLISEQELRYIETNYKHFTSVKSFYEHMKY